MNRQKIIGVLLRGLLFSGCHLLTQNAWASPKACPDLAEAYTSSFNFDFQITYEEKSRDSHRYIYKMKYDGKQMTYYGPHGPCKRGRCPHKTLHFVLSKDAVESMLQLAEEQKLWNGFSEREDTEAIGNAVSTTISLQQLDKRSKLTIVGMNRIWKTNKSNLSPQATERLQALEKLQKMVTEQAKKCEDLMQ